MRSSVIMPRPTDPIKVPTLKKPREMSKVRQSTTVLPKRPELALVKTASAKWDLLDSEKQQFGDRCPKGMIKKKLLGKGGVAIVWLASDDQGKEVALKQFPKSS